MDKKQHTTQPPLSCQQHLDKPAEYYCLTCKHMLCDECRTSHKKESHAIETCKETALDMMEELSKHGGQSTLDKQLAETETKMEKLIKGLELTVYAVLRGFRTRHGTISKINWESEDQKLKWLKGEKRFAELYLHCHDLKKLLPAEMLAKEAISTAELAADLSKALRKMTDEYCAVVDSIGGSRKDSGGEKRKGSDTTAVKGVIAVTCMVIGLR